MYLYVSLPESFEVLYSTSRMCGYVFVDVYTS